MRTSRTFYHPELDALRFVAFLLVFFAHATMMFTLRWDRLSPYLGPAMFALRGAGLYGVDLFFVLSSYLITELLLQEQERTGKLDLRKFYLRRILRIWPLYFAFLLVIEPVAEILLKGDRLSMGTLAAFLLLVGNWHCVFFGFPLGAAAPLWSISVEEQFYLLWPPLLQVARRYLTELALAMLVLANLARGLSFLHPLPDPALWCDTLTRLDPIAGGVLLAKALHGRENRMRPLPRLSLGVAAAALLLLVGFYGDHANLRALWSYPTAGLACTLLVFVTLVPNDSWTPGVLGQTLVYLGRISYGLYVFHALVLQGATRLWKLPAYAVLPLAFALTVLLATASYRLLELPFLRLKARYTVVRTRDSEIVSESRKTG